jgi:hypothetical protein
VLLGVLHGAAWCSLALLDPPLPLLFATTLVLAAQAAHCIRRDALGSSDGAPVAVELRVDGSARLALRGRAEQAARVTACSVRVPGLVVLELATAHSRVGVLVTAGRVGAHRWRRLQVLVRWGLDPGLSRRRVNSPGPRRSVAR